MMQDDVDIRRGVLDGSRMHLSIPYLKHTCDWLMDGRFSTVFWCGCDCWR
jgi:hypothetical protein